MNNLSKTLTFLGSKGLKLGSVESMTAGLFASSVASIPGASKVFEGSIVSYSPRVKSELVGVAASIIDKEGVVSAEVARAMAENGAKALGVDVCVSVTGNAGPTTCPGYGEVGEFFVGVYVLGATIVTHYKESGARNIVREKAVDKMANSLYEALKSI